MTTQATGEANPKKIRVRFEFVIVDGPPAAELLRIQQKAFTEALLWFVQHHPQQNEPGRQLRGRPGQTEFRRGEEPPVPE